MLVLGQILSLTQRWSARTILKPNQVAPGDGEELPVKGKKFLNYIPHVGKQSLFYSPD